MVREHYVGLLRKALKNQLGDVGRLEYNIVVDNSSKNGTPNTTKMPSCGNAAETKMH
jgi:chromosomal replication initiator protein